MRKADVYVGQDLAGVLEDVGDGTYVFDYAPDYAGPPVSLTMPVANRKFTFDRFPPYFEGVLPEGMMLEALLRQAKLDRDDLFGQLVTVGEELVGAATVREQR